MISSNAIAYKVESIVIGAGASDLNEYTSSSYGLSTTIGETIISQEICSSNYCFSLGYWYAIEGIIESDTNYEWIKPTKDPLKINRLELFDVNLQVNCINNDCGDTNVYLYYSRGIFCVMQTLIGEGTALKLESGSNPFQCGDMNEGNTCYAFFQLRGISIGGYELLGKIVSENTSDNYTVCGERTIQIKQVDSIPLFLMALKGKDLLPLFLMGGGLILGGIILWKRRQENQTS